jgi:hypothetical protein
MSLVKDKTTKIELFKNVLRVMATIEMKPMSLYMCVFVDESSFF